ncbi:hypothetical protein Cpir12675_004021 [Ceratocystis pirilliformis]|uniref:Carboxylic ester hydrolase n=1 Tax=Ceratocystis pirilliformis TaxID=259994 RepID=A0ABR3Z2D5_9PEZI
MKVSSVLAAIGAFVSAANAASLTQVTSFGNNPTGAKMYTFQPDNLEKGAPVVLVLHYCGGTANAMYANTGWATAAAKYGFTVIYGETPNASGCWDVSSPATLSHDGNGDSTSIANMVRYAVQEPNIAADPKRVFVTGISSGAMMTNVLSAAYPELFAAATSYAGVAAGCFYTGSVAGWNSTCSSGQSIHTPQEWASIAKAMDPGYNGPRPSMTLYHGTEDTTINSQNLQEALKQWTGVFGYSMTGGQASQNQPINGWTTTVYGPKVRGVVAQGVTHSISMQVDNDLKLFGIA